jgi:hypothetical protein
MMKLQPSNPRYSFKTIECAEPMSQDEIDDLRLQGWRIIRANKRWNKRGVPYLQYELERHDRPAVGSVENR